jgi:transposase-like protein
MENGKGVRKRDSRIQVGNSRIYEEKQSVAQIARDFGIRESLIPRWKKAFWGTHENLPGEEPRKKRKLCAPVREGLKESYGKKEIF